MEDEQGGYELREKHMKAIDDDFAAANVSNDGILKKEEYKNYCILANRFDEELGIRTREVTDEYVELTWECFNQYHPEYEGVTKDDLCFIHAFTDSQYETKGFAEIRKRRFAEEGLKSYFNDDPRM